MSDPTSNPQKFITEKAEKLSELISNLVRGTILCSWMLVLALVALFSLKDTLSEAMIETISENLDTNNLWSPLDRYYDEVAESNSDQPCPSVSEMEYYLGYSNQENPVPLSATLNQVEPQWEAKWLYKKEGTKANEVITCDYLEAEQVLNRYEEIRGTAIAELRAIASEENLDIKTAKIDKSAIFRAKNVQPELIDLPKAAKSWLKRERALLKQNQESLALLSTFMRLSILGAFGAIIFLIRDFTTPEGKTKPISTYLFRPFLGVFLAIAVFVVDIMAHSVISTASILQIRPEPLYILALAAGLLSERVYDAIQNKVQVAIDEYTEEKKEEKAE